MAPYKKLEAAPLLLFLRTVSVEWVSFPLGCQTSPMQPPGPSHQLFTSVLARLLQQMAGSQGPGTALSCFCGVPGANIFIRTLFRYDSVPQNSPTYNTTQWFLVDSELCKRHHSQFESISILPKRNLKPISSHYPSPPPSHWEPRMYFLCLRI